MSETPMTPERLAEIAARAEAATPGPWVEYPQYGPNFYAYVDGSYLRGVGTMNFGDGEDADADREFVLHARTDVPALLATIERLRARLDDVHRVPQDNLTPAEVRLGQYTQPPRTFGSDTERALFRIACGLRDTLEETRDQRTAARLLVAGLKERVAELETEREKLVRWHGEDSETITKLLARVERRRAELVALRNDALNMRGSLSPADGDRRVPFELGETLAPAVDWLIARVAELEARLAEFERPADEDPIAYALTEQAEPVVDGCPRNVIDGDVGGHFYKHGAFVDGPMRCVYCGGAKPEDGDR